MLGDLDISRCSYLRRLGLVKPQEWHLPDWFERVCWLLMGAVAGAATVIVVLSFLLIWGS